ncbi:MAG: ATP-binding protein [Ferrovibrio sp.]|uniref:sensor histidine kinase n=1 Tax=Ferrovibrio sp. TaxID=1917215 RepID=UPI002607F321|nr:ATP-binding protein [Ferrovibrio sp.]MCW0234584.1 ATP-binding protein [Ferrovibrio sp.]
MASPIALHIAGDEPVRRPAGKILLHSIVAAAVVGIAGIGVFALSRAINVTSASILFVPVILGAAIFGGMIPSLTAALASLAACSVLFYNPAFSLPNADPQEFADIFVFAGVAIASSQLAGYARRAAATSRRREAMMEYLLAFNRRISAVVDPAETPALLADELSHGLGCAVAIYLDDADGLREVAAAGTFGVVPPRALAQQAWRQREHDSTVPSTYMLRSGGAPIGVIVLGPEPASRLDPLAIAAMMEQSGLAMARMRLALRVEEARVQAKAEDLREAVLGSISHDLHTPLASILGSVTTLEKFGPICDDATRTELQSTIREEAERLERYIRRMLDLTRIRAGRLMPQPEPVDVADIANAALRQTQKVLARHRIESDDFLDLPMVQTDPVLIEQALVNILENAAKYSPPGSAIALRGRVEAGRVVLGVHDSGIGLEKSDAEQIFAPFYRAADASSGQVAGNGLGLMVSKAFVEAAGCEIWADSRGPGQGAAFHIGMPLAKTLQVADEGEAA